MSDEDKPFVCPQPDCGMQFTNEDHLSVHIRKHDMSLALNLTPSVLSPIGLFTDQTPTPTKFLKNCEELGLFQELSKNPFDDSFKKAMDEHSSGDSTLHLPDAENNNLDTPQPPVPKIVIGDEEFQEKYQDKPKDLTSPAVLPKKRKFLLSQNLPTSTTTEDEEEAVIGSSSIDLTGSSSDSDIISPSIPVDVTSSMKLPASTGALVQGSGGISLQGSVSMPVQSANSILVQGTSSAPLHGTSTIPLEFTCATSMLSLQRSSSGTVQISSSDPVQVSSSGPVHFTNSKPVLDLTLDSVNGPHSVPVICTEQSEFTAVPLTTQRYRSLSGGHTMNRKTPAATNLSSPGMITSSVPLTTIPIGSPPGVISSPLMVTVMLQLPGGQFLPLQVPASSVAGTSQVSPIIVPVNNQTQPVINVVQSSPPGLGMTLPTIPQNNVQTAVNQHALLGQTGSVQTAASLNQSVAHSGLTPLVVQNQTTSVSQTLLQPVQKRSKMQHKVIQPGSQSYTKERLKAAIQQQITPGSQKGFAVTAVKSEPQWSLGSDFVSSGAALPQLGESLDVSMASLQGSLDSTDGTNKGGDNELRREKFLERNRAAAARCRQKRKNWVQNLERKADDLSSVNTKLLGEIKKLRHEVAMLKTLLLAHKDCPVTLQQKSQGNLTDILEQDNDLSDVLPIEVNTAGTVQTVSQVSSATTSNQPSVTANQSTSPVPLPVRLVPNMVSNGEQIFSVITGSNSLSLIPKLFNLSNNMQLPSSKS